MQTVSMFLDEAERRAGGPKNLLALINEITGRSPAYSQPTIPMWKRRGIPWPQHAAMYVVCTRLGMPADPRVWRNTQQPKVAA